MMSIGSVASCTKSSIEPRLGVVIGLWEWKETLGVVDKKTRKCENASTHCLYSIFNCKRLWLSVRIYENSN